MKYPLILLCLLILSCANIPQRTLDSTFWTKKNVPIGIILHRLPPPFVYKEGYQSILDLFLNGLITAPLEDHLHRLNIDTFNNWPQKFKLKLEKIGISNVTILQKKLTDTSLYFYDESCQGEYCLPLDYRVYKEQAQVDFILVLSIKDYGVRRKYHRFTPLSPLQGYCMGEGLLVNTHTNELIWKYTMDKSESVVPLRGEYMGYPNYPLVTTAIYEAIENAHDVLFTEFFTNAYISQRVNTHEVKN